MLIQDISHGLLHLFFPALCEGCQQPLVKGESILCIRCAVMIPRTAFHGFADNETAVRFTGRVPYRHATSYAWFTAGGLLQHLLHRLKYDSQKSIGKDLGQRFGEEIKDLDWARSIDEIIPVPLHPKKYAERGFNQSAVIAGGLGEALGKPVADGMLKRTRHTQSQTQKNREERITNVADAFAATRPDKLRGKHLLLLDDVLTTGATMEAAANALLTIPGITVSLATIGLAQQ